MDVVCEAGACAIYNFERPNMALGGITPVAKRTLASKQKLAMGMPMAA